MHSVAEFGVAAHFLYKENGSVENALTKRQSEWLVKLQDSVTRYQTKDKREDFQDNMTVELLDSNIFIYTPK
jgi:GTP pyrophosphokinase